MSAQKSNSNTVWFNFQTYVDIYISSKYIRARVAQWVRSLDSIATHTSLSPIRRGFAPGFVNYKKGCTRLAAASDEVYQLLAHGLWFSPGTPASSTTKTGCHDIDEILLKVALNSKNQSTKYICSCDLWHLLTSNMAIYYFSTEQGTSYAISSWHGIYIYWCCICCQWIHKTGR
jgi:hypothetical protein